MEYVNFYERIKNITDLNLLSQKICNLYKLGEVISYKHIAIGYEDFNMVLETEKGKYFAKILNKSRPQEEQLRLAKILDISIQNNISVPKVHKIGEDSILTIKLENKELNVILMDYIEGTNMLFLERDFEENEIRNVAKQMALINQIDYDVDSYYDEWTITNFENEYNKKINALDDDNKILVSNVYNQMKSLDFNKFKNAYIHGDIIKSNLILDKSNNIWVIDFSVLNFLPRIIEIAVAMFGICLTNDREKTIRNINILVNEYNKNLKLDEYEIENLSIIFNCISAMNVLQTAYIKNTDESFEENEHWLKEGRKGIELNLTKDDIKLF